MTTYLHLEKSQPQALPADFQGDDVRYPESLVEHFLRDYTRAGGTVLDPFAGHGTTLIVAERLGRIPFGVELTDRKVNFARSKLTRPERLIQGDSRFLAAIDLPAIDFSMTSPPYVAKDDLDDPFTDYQAKGQGYATYLRDIRSIYGQLRKHMKPAGTIILEVANLKLDGRVTTLAWDVAQEISMVLRFEGEVIICWDKNSDGYVHSYCLVYSALGGRLTCRQSRLLRRVAVVGIGAEHCCRRSFTFSAFKASSDRAAESKQIELPAGVD